MLKHVITCCTRFSPFLSTRPSKYIPMEFVVTSIFSQKIEELRMHMNKKVTKVLKIWLRWRFIDPVSLAVVSISKGSCLECSFNSFNFSRRRFLFLTCLSLSLSDYSTHPSLSQSFYLFTPFWKVQAGTKTNQSILLFFLSLLSLIHSFYSQSPSTSITPSFPSVTIFFKRRFVDKYTTRLNLRNKERRVPVYVLLKHGSLTSESEWATWSSLRSISQGSWMNKTNRKRRERRQKILLTPHLLHFLVWLSSFLSTLN